MRCMELCITVRSLFPNLPKANESGSITEPSICRPHSRLNLLRALPLSGAASETSPIPVRPPAPLPGLQRPPALRPAAGGDAASPSPSPPPRGQVLAPGPSLRPYICHCRRRRQGESPRGKTWRGFLGVKVPSNFRFLRL